MKVGTLYLENEIDGVIEGGVCPMCKREYSATMARTLQKGSAFFIPIPAKTVRYFTKCPHCGIEYGFHASDYKEIMKTRDSKMLNSCCERTQANV